MKLAFLITYFGLVLGNLKGQELKTVEEKLEVSIGIDEIIKLDYPFNPKIEIGDPSKLTLKRRFI